MRRDNDEASCDGFPGDYRVLVVMVSFVFLTSTPAAAQTERGGAAAAKIGAGTAHAGRASGSHRRVVARPGHQPADVDRRATRRREPERPRAPPSFSSLYQPWAAEKAKTLGHKDDPALWCIPSIIGPNPVGNGLVGEIVQTAKTVVMLIETYHGFRVIPTDGRPHRDDVVPSYKGDAVGHWEGDTLVVDVTNFSDKNWLNHHGNVSFHSDALHMVERYRLVDSEHARDQRDRRGSEGADRTLEGAADQVDARAFRARDGDGLRESMRFRR